jgi:hypothetical protein
LLPSCTRPRFSRGLDHDRGEPAPPDPFSRENRAGKWDFLGKKGTWRNIPENGPQFWGGPRFSVNREARFTETRGPPTLEGDFVLEVRRTENSGLTSPGEGRSPENHYLPGFFGAPAYLLQYCTRPRFSRVLDLFRGEPARPDPFSREIVLVSGIFREKGDLAQYPGKWTSSSEASSRTNYSAIGHRQMSEEFLRDGFATKSSSGGGARGA